MFIHLITLYDIIELSLINKYHINNQTLSSVRIYLNIYSYKFMLNFKLFQTWPKFVKVSDSFE